MDLFAQSLGIFVVFALMGVTLWWLKKKSLIRMVPLLPARWAAGRSRAGGKLLERVDGLRLSPTHSLSLIRMADRAILVGISPAGFCLIESLPWKSAEPVGNGERADRNEAGREWAGQEAAQREQVSR